MASCMQPSMGSRPSGRRGEVGDVKPMVRMKMVWESRKGKRKFYEGGFGPWSDHLRFCVGL